MLERARELFSSSGAEPCCHESEFAMPDSYPCPTKAPHYVEGTADILTLKAKSHKDLGRQAEFVHKFAGFEPIQP
jgi:hypothetical protein